MNDETRQRLDRIFAEREKADADREDTKAANEAKEAEFNLKLQAALDETVRPQFEEMVRYLNGKGAQAKMQESPGAAELKVSATGARTSWLNIYGDWKSESLQCRWGISDSNGMTEDSVSVGLSDATSDWVDAKVSDFVEQALSGAWRTP